MSIAPCPPNVFPQVAVPATESQDVAAAVEKPRLHRLATVRRREGVSRRTLSRRLKMPVSQIKQLEDETRDIPVSVLYKWQKALGVPITELLVDCDEPLSAPVRDRARMLRIMKTAVTILERSRQPSTKRLAKMLVDQILELMPELDGVSAWPAVGKSRQPNDLGQAFYRRLPADVFRPIPDDE